MLIRFFSLLFLFLIFSSTAFSQTADSLQTIKADFIVNTHDGNYGASQLNIAGASSSEGSYAFAWIDRRNGYSDIYTQFYKNGKSGNNVKVSIGTTNNANAFIAANKNGDYVIVWNSYEGVHFQRFSDTGEKTGNIIKVGNTSGIPSAAVNNDGSFLIVINSGGNIYTVFVNSLGNPGGTPTLIYSGAYNYNSLSFKNIAVDSSGNYCITWSSFYNSKTKIYLQRINSVGIRIGDKVMVTPSADDSNDSDPVIASTDDGRFLIAWIKSQTGVNNRIGARVYNQNDNSFTDVLDFESSIYFNFPPHVSSDRDSLFYVSYYSGSNYYVRKIRSDGEFQGAAQKVQLSENYLYDFYSVSFTDMIEGKLYAASSVWLRNDLDVIYQGFNSSFLPAGTAEKINDDIGSADQLQPVIRFNNLGDYIVLWSDKRNGRTDLYCQVFSSDDNPVGGNLQINDSNQNNWELKKVNVVSQSDGTFIVTFTGRAEDYKDYLYLQKVSRDGKKVGSNKIHSLQSQYFSNFNIVSNKNKNDEILVAWYNQYGSYLKKFDSQFNSLSPEIKLMEPDSGTNFISYSIAIDTAFNVFAAWNVYSYSTGGNRDIWGRYFNVAGKAVSDKFIIDSSNFYFNNIAIAMENKNYLISKNEYSNSYLKRKYSTHLFTDKITSKKNEIVRFENQKVFLLYYTESKIKGFFANDNKRISFNYELFNLDPLDYYNAFFSAGADIFNDKIVFVYPSNRNGGTGYDIWANVRKINDFNFNQEYFYKPSNSDVLYPNFPNPFNPKTKITYEILAYTRVKLSVYNILGEEVKILVDKTQDKGIHEVEFDASGLASGIYFYKLEAFDTSIKKMIYLK